MLDKVFQKMGYDKILTPEAALDMYIASERKVTGWIRSVTREGQLLGFRFYCPGKIIKTTRPLTKVEQEATGNNLTTEVPTMQRVGCAFVSTEILPMQTLADVHVRCAQCGTESTLLSWMRENKLAHFESIPTEQRMPTRSQRQIVEIGVDSEEYKYAASDPGGI